MRSRLLAVLLLCKQPLVRFNSRLLQGRSLAVVTKWI